MSTWLAVVHIPSRTDIPEDEVVNTFALDTLTADPDAFEFDDVAVALAGFYNHVQAAAGQRLAYYLANGLSRAASGCRIMFYDISAHLDGSPHGSPLHERVFALDGARDDNAMPDEVASCLTLRAAGWQVLPIEEPDDGDPGSAVQRPRQRYAGRIYIGPLNYFAATIDGNKRARPSVAFQQLLLECATNLFDDLQGVGAGWSWCVWSRANAEVNIVSHVQVDDAFDTQRRRGVAATARETRTTF